MCWLLKPHLLEFPGDNFIEKFKVKVHQNGENTPKIFQVERLNCERKRDFLIDALDSSHDNETHKKINSMRHGVFNRDYDRGKKEI